MHVDQKVFKDNKIPSNKNICKYLYSVMLSIHLWTVNKRWRLSEQARAARKIFALVLRLCGKVITLKKKYK